MDDALLGLALISAVGVIWTFLSRYLLGRVVQVAVAAAIYAAWFSIIPLSIYFVGSDVGEELAVQNYGTAVFIAVVSLLITPIFLFPFIPWNHFCQYVWRKVGLRLPQSDRLDGKRPYNGWERER
jgi:hypothetical protein